jgi:hypothetical protein
MVRPRLAKGGLALGERTSCRCRAGSQGRLEERLRYATQAAGAFARCLLADLSRFQASHRRAQLMKAFRGPALTPGLQHAAPLPVPRRREQKARGVPEGGGLVHAAQPVRPRALQAYHCGQGPRRLRVARAAAPPHRPTPCRMGAPQLCGYGRAAPPLAWPWARARARAFTAPVLPPTLKIARQGDGPYPVVERLRRLGTMPLVCQLVPQLQA